MSTPNFAVEGHFYSGGLRTTLFHESIRPEWLPPTDMVGFRDEFNLRSGDFAVEFRRFTSQNRSITWLGIFYPSIDVKFGDRKNHAGVGVWIDDGVVVFPQKLLKALSQLADGLSQDPDPHNLAPHVHRFVGSSFLPTYLHNRRLFPPTLAGIPFGEVAPCDTSLLSIDLSDISVNSWVRLSNLITNLSFSPRPIVDSPRVLVLASALELGGRSEKSLPCIGEEFDDLSQFLSEIPTIWSDAAARMESLRTTQSQLTTELVELKNQHEKALIRDRQSEIETATVKEQLNTLQKSPEAAILRKVSEISSEVISLRKDMQNLSRSIKSLTELSRSSSQHHLSLLPTSESKSSSAYGESWLERVNINTWLLALVAIIAIAIILVVGLKCAFSGAPATTPTTSTSDSSPAFSKHQQPAKQ